MDNGVRWRSCVSGVFPGVLISGTLEGVDNGVSTGDDLVVVHLQVAQRASGGNPDMHVIDKIRSTGIVVVGD